MAKKNFTDSLMGGGRSRKLDMLVPTSGKEEPEETAVEEVEAKEPAPAKEAPAAKEKKAAKTETAPAEAKEEKPKKKKRGRKKNDVEKDSFFYTVEKDFLFEVRAAAFWDRRDISEFISLALRHYMYEEMGESEIRRAAKEYRKRLEE